MGLVLDKDGNKMSKSKGNAVDPMDALDKFGADAIRWYFYNASAPWLPKKFSEKAVTEYAGRFLGTLWNTYAFWVLYANIDKFDPTKYTLDYDKLSVMDRWLLSRMNTMVRDVDSNMSQYRIPETAKALESFVDDMSNWYVRRSRSRFWAGGMEQDKINAYMTLYTALVTVCKAAAPMVPFMTESIYQNIVRGVDSSAPESIHLCSFPTVDESKIDADLEAKMAKVMRIVVLGRSARNASNIKNRQPLSKMYVRIDEPLDDFYTAIVREELNVGEVIYDSSLKVQYSLKPQLKTVGPKFGKLVGGIRKALAGMNGADAVAELKENGSLVFTVDGQQVSLGREDLLIDIAQTEGFSTQSDGTVTVMLDTKLTPELIEQGFVAEIISKIQTMRKEAGFEVMDRIRVYAEGSGKIEEILRANDARIRKTVMADEIITGETKGYVKDWKINSEDVTLGVEKTGG